MVDRNDFRTLPLFQGFTESSLEAFLASFERRALTTGTVLFEIGARATHLTLLVSGTIRMSDDQGEPMLLTAPAVVGELGALTDLCRHRTATIASDANVLTVSRERLLETLVALPEVAFIFHQNLLGVVSDKVERDEQRLSEMRANIVRTQKTMKRLRDHVLTEFETTISESVHDTLEELIARNRRVNYSVKPPRSMPASVRWSQGGIEPIQALSRTTLRLSNVQGFEDGATCQGVLVLPEQELPIDGTVSVVNGRGIEVTLEPLIDEYGRAFENYLTRSQTLDLLF